MLRRNIVACLAAILAPLTLSAPGSADEATIQAVQEHLYAGDTTEAASAAEARLAAAPDDDQARFALGAVQFLQAVENLGQAFYRHGLATGDPSTFGGMMDLPFVRMPVPFNPDPQPLDYEAFRGVLQAFADDLAKSEATLAAIGAESDIALPLNLGLIRLDMDGNGAASDEEALWRIVQVVANAWWLDGPAAERLLTDFDSSDVPWLQSYCHLLMAIAEFPLAHDWQAAFDNTFHGVFPNAGLPSAALNERPSEPGQIADYSGLVDLIAFIHLNHWPVAEPERMNRVLAHLEAVPELSRENWRRILAETDRGREWIPNPGQSGIFPEIQVTQEQIDGWMLFLSEFEALLKGEKLLPHWRFDRGINLRRMFTEPRTFDIVLLLQGSGALPYLEDGELTSAETWRRISQLLDGNLFRYTVWFN